MKARLGISKLKSSYFTSAFTPEKKLRENFAVCLTNSLGQQSINGFMHCSMYPFDMRSIMLSSLTGFRLDTEVPCTGVLVEYGHWEMRFRENSKLSKILPKPARRKCRGVCPRLILKVGGERGVGDSPCASLSA